MIKCKLCNRIAIIVRNKEYYCADCELTRLNYRNNIIKKLKGIKENK